MYRYGEFETMLVALHGIAPENRATLRARLKYYRRLGMFGEAENERNLSYKFEDLIFYAFMLEIAQFGIDPQRMVQIATVVWPECKGAVFDENSHRDDDLMFVAMPVVLSSSIVEIKKSLEYRVSGLTYLKNSEPRYTYLKNELVRLKIERSMLINLSALYRRVESAIEHYGGRTDVSSQT